MNFLKRFGKAFTYLVLFALGIYLFTPSIIDVLNSDQGVLVTLATIVSEYLKHADTWSWIFMTISFGLGFGIFIGISYLLDKLFNRIGRKLPKFNFINSFTGDILLQIPIAFVFLIFFFVLGSNLYVSYTGSLLTTDDINDIPQNSNVFVLGTSKYLSSGKENMYYSYRLDAAEELWKTGKVKQFILSGDGVGAGHTEAYDETKDMKEDLLSFGVPENKIKIDKYGFNTQQSIIRLRGVFSLNDVVIVSQDFHNLRAVVSCDFYGIKSLGYNAKGSSTWAMHTKEFLSRPKIIAEMLYANIQPKVNYDGNFEYREEFNVTESNKHVLIVITMFFIVIVSLIGYGIYLSKKGEEKKKVGYRISVFTGGLTVFLFILTIITYQTLDLKVIDEFVETTAAVVGVETKKMEVKKLAALSSKPISPLVAVVSSPVIETENEAEPLKEEPKITKEEKPDFNTIEAERKETPATPVAPVAKEEVKDEDPFNTSSVESDQYGSEEKTAIKADRKHLKVKVHNSQTIYNDGKVFLRLDEPATINGKSYPKNFVFEATTVLYNSRYIIITESFAGLEMKSYDGPKEGNKIEGRHLGKKDEITLADGEPITLGY